MKHERHFETSAVRDNKQRDGLTALLENLRHIVGALESSIQNEEHRTGKHDPSHSDYPIAASTMAQRRDNLKTTIAVLEQRLG